MYIYTYNVEIHIYTSVSIKKKLQMHNQQMNAKHKQIENSRAIMNKYK